MGVAVTIEGKEIDKGYIVIDLKNNLVQYKNNMNGEVLRTFDTNKDVNVYCDIADVKNTGVYSDIRTLGQLTLDNKAFAEREIKRLKAELGDRRIMYDTLRYEYIKLSDKYKKIKKLYLGTVDEADEADEKNDKNDKPDYKWYEKFT